MGADGGWLGAALSGDLLVLLASSQAPERSPLPLRERTARPQARTLAGPTAEVVHEVAEPSLVDPGSCGRRESGSWVARRRARPRRSSVATANPRVRAPTHRSGQATRLPGQPDP